MKNKVLFIMPALLGGGAEKVLIDILKYFDHSRYEVTLLLEYREGVYLEDIPKEVELITLHGPNNLWFQRLHRRLIEHGWYSWFHKTVYKPLLLKKLKGQTFDTIISFMEGAAVKFHSYITDKAKNNVSWVHIDLKMKHWSLAFFKDQDEEQNCYRMMDKIVFVSDDARQRFLELFDVDANKCLVQYNLIDGKQIVASSQSKEITKNKFTICMTGRLNQQKRYDRAIAAASLLKRDGYDFELWVLGEGELRTALEEQIKAEGLEDVVLLKGFVKPPHAYVKEADIFLNTSESEGYPLTLCEALCLGLPVVATRITGATEILDRGKYGVLVEEDIASIYSGLKSLMDNEALRQGYAQKALERSQMFDVQHTMNQIYTIVD